MSALIGVRLGPYQIDSTLGAGGMGEVYRAHDTRLGRDVALKILPAAFAGDPDRVARFRREAQLLAALNHPHIATIHGLEEADGVTALVMELVDGPTLADRIADGPIPLDEALGIAKQIALALEAAHQHGIVHRDLKPANVKLTRDDTVKLLDFGLAKALEPAAAALDGAQATITSPAMTALGVVLGTASYMAPEQARGKAVDKRADIWAFGVVLFEMLTGRRPFAGDDVTETIALVVKGQPDLTQIPQPVRRLIAKCLEKDPNQRLRDVGDAWELIDRHDAHPVVPPRGRQRWFLAGGAVLLAGIALGAVTVWLLGSRSDVVAVPTRFAESLPEHRTMPEFVGLTTAVAISPDGRTVVYRAMENGDLRLYRRFLDQPAAEPIGDVGAAEPFFSPDGRWVGFHIGNILRRVSVQGGPAQTIATLPGLGYRGASWGAGGAIVLGGSTGDLWRVSESGGEVTTLVKSAAQGISYPQWLPGEGRILYTERQGRDIGGDTLMVLDLPTSATTRLLPGGAGRYVSTGHLVFVREGTLFGVPFDVGSLSVRGSPAPVIPGIRSENSATRTIIHIAIGATGALAYVPSSLDQQRSLVWVDRQNREQSLGAPVRAYANPRVSPDGTRVAVTMRDEGRDVWIWDIARRTLRQLTSDPGPNWLEAWFPDTNRLAFSAVIEGHENVYTQAADGSGVPLQLTSGSLRTLPYAISRGGQLLTVEYAPDVTSDIGVLSLDNPNNRRTLRKTAENERNAVLSPNGKWIAYESNKSGRFEIFVRPFPDVEAAEYKITTDGGHAPLWAHNRSELFYWKETGTAITIMSVPVTADATFDFGAATAVIKGRYARPSWDTHYDLAPDGRFLLLKSAQSPKRDEVVVILNWQEDLKRVVPRP